MGAVGALTRKLEHPRPKRRQDPREGHGRGRRVRDRGVHLVEVARHVRHGVGIDLPAALDHGRMARPDAQHEPSRPRRGKRRRPALHRRRVTRPDVGDAGTEDDPRGRRQRHRGMSKRILAADPLSRPHRAVPELLDATDRGRLVRHRCGAQRARPHTDGSKPFSRGLDDLFHARHRQLSWSAMVCPRATYALLADASLLGACKHEDLVGAQLAATGSAHVLDLARSSNWSMIPRLEQAGGGSPG